MGERRAAAGVRPGKMATEGVAGGGGRGRRRAAPRHPTGGVRRGGGARRAARPSARSGGGRRPGAPLQFSAASRRRCCRSIARRPLAGSARGGERRRCAVLPHFSLASLARAARGSQLRLAAAADRSRSRGAVDLRRGCLGRLSRTAGWPRVLAQRPRLFAQNARARAHPRCCCCCCCASDGLSPREAALGCWRAASARGVGAAGGGGLAAAAGRRCPLQECEGCTHATPRASRAASKGGQLSSWVT